MEINKDKKLIIFDLDGTLTESKSDMDEEMASLLGRLLKIKLVAVIGGGKFEQFQNQFLFKLSVPAGLLKKLFLFPTTGTAFYRYNGNDWEKIYSQEFSPEEKEKIFSALDKTFSELNYQHPDKIYGEVIEDRGAEIAFSALGQDAPFEIKKKWSQENLDTRSKIAEILKKYLPDMEVKVTGLTSVDITRKGIDKVYSIEQIQKYLGVFLDDMLFVGDAFFEGGNDEPVLRTGVSCFKVKGVEDTKKFISSLIS